MKKSLIVSVAALLVLCLLAPFASQAPDPVQKLIGLPGGAGSFVKALLGLTVTWAAVSALALIFKYLKARRS